MGLDRVSAGWLARSTLVTLVTLVTNEIPDGQKRKNPRATPLARDQVDKPGQPGGPVYALY